MGIDTLWFTRCPAPSAASIAIRAGWLNDEFQGDGISVISLAASNKRTVHQSHYENTQPNSFRFGGYVPPLISRSRGTDIRIIGLGLTDKPGGIYALPGSPLRHVLDLKGRRLAVPRRLNDKVDWWRATVLAGYEKALSQGNLTFDDVELVEIGIERQYIDDVTTGTDHAQSLWGARSQFAVQREEVMALIQGRVDALYTDAAMGALLLSFLGLQPVALVDGRADGPPGNFPYSVVLTVSGRLLDELPDLVHRWLVRLLDAKGWAAAHEAEAKRMIAQDTGVPEDLVELAFCSRVHRQLDVTLDEKRVGYLLEKHALLLKHGMIDTPIDFNAFIDHRPLRDAMALHAERHSSLRALSG